MGKQHSPRFLEIVRQVKVSIQECTVDDVKGRLDRGETFHLIDVREESEFATARLPGALHLSKGVIERDIEGHVPDTSSEIVVYCGGGFRSALVAHNLQLMGYEKVISMDGGIRGWREKSFPLTSDETSPDAS